MCFLINAAAFLTGDNFSGADDNGQEIILTLDDFGIKNSDDAEPLIIRKKSIAASIVKYMEGSDDKSLWYDDFCCDKKLIYDYYLNWIINNKKKYTSLVDISDKFSLHQDEKVYSLYNGNDILLQLDGQIIFIGNSDIDKDKEEVVNKVLQKVKNKLSH